MQTKKFLSPIILLALSTVVSGQGLSFSVVFDPQISWMSTDSRRVEPDGSMFGFNAGLVTDIFFADNYAFSTGISIWKTGGNLNFLDSTSIDFGGGDTEILPPDTRVTYHMQYITIPLGLKLKTNEIGYIRFYAHLGINNHINIKATADASSGNINGDNIKNEIQIYNMSYFIGGGMEYSLGGNTALITGIYYTNGILDLAETSDFRSTLNAVSLRLGIKF